MRLTPSALLLSPAGHFIVRSTFHRRVAAFIARSVFILLLWGLGGGGALIAQTQNGVNVSGLAVNAGTVTFNVSWENTGDMPTLWSDSVWVFVEYNVAGAMTRLPLLSGATLTATSPGGEVIEETDNNKGVWVVGNAKSAGAGSFSATVKLLTAAADIPGACAYASNYPPVGKYTSATEIAFTGTPGYDLVFAGGATTYTESSPYTVPGGYTVQSFTDKTGAPGKLSCMPMTGSIDFSAPPNVPKGLATSFEATTSNFTAPNAAAITYTWSAANFNPSSGTGILYVPAAPANTGIYEVTVTASSTGYCDLETSKTVTVIDCTSSATYNLTVSATAYCAGGSVTFELSNTTLGRTYRLYKDGDPVDELAGTGNPATFTGAFAGAGVYTAQVIAEDGNCTAVMTGSHTVSENPLPAAPTGASANSRCGNGTVTFSASVPSEHTIDWYTTSAGSELVSGGSGTTSISPSLTASTTYHAQSRNNTTGCVSTSRLAVTGTVNPIPSAPTMAGSSSYCTSGTITATAGSGGNGIQWDNTSTTSLRTISATGSYYAVTTSAAGCTSSSATKSVTIVKPGTSGNAATACGCASGLTNCSNTCKSSASYTADGSCSSSCNIRYVASYGACGNLLNAQYSTRTDAACTTGCTPSVPAQSSTCLSNASTNASANGSASCNAVAKSYAAGYKYYNYTWKSSTCTMYRCN